MNEKKEIFGYNDPQPPTNIEGGYLNTSDYAIMKELKFPPEGIGPIYVYDGPETDYRKRKEALRRKYHDLDAQGKAAWDKFDLQRRIDRQRDIVVYPVYNIDPSNLHVN